MVDAGPCPVGQTAFPANMRMRRVTTVANLDVSLGSTSDDVLTWGREPGPAGPGTGSAYAYIQLGGAALNPGCYATRLSFGTDNIEPLDVWVGEVTGDAHSDVLLLGHSQASLNRYVVRLFRGRANGTLDPTPDERAFNSNVRIGGSLTDQEPVFITAWRPPPTAMGQVEVVIGGLFEPLQAMTIDATGHLEAAREVALGLPPDDLISYPQEATTRGEQLVIVSQKRAYRFEHDSRDPTMSTYASQGTPALIDDGRPRSARFNQPAAGAPLLGVTARAGGFALITVPSGPLNPSDPAATVRTLDAPGSASTGNAPDVTDLDLALATLDPGPNIDLVVLAESSATTFLHVFPNLRDSGATAFATDPRLAVDVAGGNMLAVGDFDGDPTTPIEVLVRSSNLSQASCFHVIGSPNCLVSCDVLSCPP